MRLTLDHRDPRLRLVCDLGLTTKTHDLVVVLHACDHSAQRIREHLRVRIDAQDELVPVRADASDTPYRVEELVLERRHPLVEHHLLQERHEDDLTVTLATVSWLRVVGLERVSDLRDEYDRYALLLRSFHGGIVVVVEAGVHLCHVVSLMTVRNGDV